LSTGTFLDSLRFRIHVGRHFGVSPADVEAQVIGDHGTSQVFLWSSARVGGVPVTSLLKERAENLDNPRTQIESDVRYANITIIEGHDASQYGIGIVSTRIAEMVLRDEHAVIPIGSYQREFGVTMSLPSVIGAERVVSVMQPILSGEEESAPERSASNLRRALERARS
jgi:L-lactate dehydrogenase